MTDSWERGVTSATIRSSSSRLSARDGSRAAATSNMERFVIIVNGFQSLTIIAKRSILNVEAVLDPPLSVTHEPKTPICYHWHTDPAIICFFKVNNGSKHQINVLDLFKLTTEIPERCHWRGYNIFIATLNRFHTFSWFFHCWTRSLCVPAIDTLRSLAS